GGGVGVLRVRGEQTAVGGFGFRKIVGGFSEFAGENDVVGSLGRDLHGGEKFVAGVGGPGGLVEAGQGAPGTGFKRGVGGGSEGGRGEEFGAGVGVLAGGGEEETEGEMRLEVFGVGGGGAAVGIGGVGGLVERFLGEA